MTEFVLVRHGETDWNAAQRIQGSTDIPLNDGGREQAKLAADGLRDIAWDVILSSPLQRAYETATIIVRELGLNDAMIETNPDLRERGYGLAEGLTIAERKVRFPDDIWPDAESPEQMNSRTGTVIHELAEIHAGKRILIVAHGGWIRAALRVASNFDRKIVDRHIANASRTYLYHNGQHWSVGEVNVVPSPINS